MQWISVLKRVPDDRRNVLAWGKTGFTVGEYLTAREKFLGSTKYNPTRDGGQFDIERCQRFSFCRVTHWAEIEGPNVRGKPPKVGLGEGLGPNAEN